jgi:ABC-2 type transport system ATP-binding protein
MIVETRRVAKRFGRFEAIEDLDLAVPEGAVFALVGANGAGKSTTLRMLMNILRPDRGDITVLGTPSVKLAPRDFQRIGFVSESQKPPAGLTVAQFFAYLGGIYTNWDRGLERQLRARLELPPDRKLQHLSHGMRLKALLVGALAFHPELLVLDEPLSGLDTLVRDEVVDGLLQQAGDTTIFISSHELAEIETFTTHVAFLQDGRLLLQEEIDRLRRRFREVRVTLSAIKQPLLPLPPEWLMPAIEGHHLRFIASGHDDESRLQHELTRRFGAVRMQCAAMPLRAIASTLMQNHKRNPAP